MGREMFVLGRAPTPFDWRGIDREAIVAWVEDPSPLLHIRLILSKEARRTFAMLDRIGDHGSYTDELLILGPDDVNALIDDLDRFIRTRVYEEFHPFLNAAHIEKHWDDYWAPRITSDLGAEAVRLRSTLQNAAEHSHWLVIAL